MRSRVRLLGVLLGAALTASLFAAAPAQATVATVAGCNSNTSTGVIIYRDTGGSFARNISAKVCVAYDTNSVRTSTAIYCRTDSGAGCDIRAEVLHAKLDEYSTTSGNYQKTWANDYLAASLPGYSDGWSWLGTDVTGSDAGWPCLARAFQANDIAPAPGSIRVRFAYNGVLRTVGNATSNRVNPSC